MKLYRLALLLKSDLKKEAKAKLVEDIKKLVGELKDAKENEIGEKKLAYTIKKEKKGGYLVLEFSADTIKSDADKKLSDRDEILRHLLVRVD